MRYVRPHVFVGLSLASSMAFADTCYVTTGAELQTALNNQCQHIIVPALDGQNNPVVIAVPFQFNNNQMSWIDIGSAHNGLHLTINGTINWVGGVDTQNDGYKVMQVNGASNVTIDGTGTITSPEDPSVGNTSIAIGIRVLDGTNITIQDLSFSNVNAMVLQDSGEVNGLTLLNLKGEELVEYGVFTSTVSNLHIEDCRVGDPNNSQVTGTYQQHGFRLYVRTYPDTGVANVLNCTAHEVWKAGLWVLHGDDITIDGFTTDSYVRIGPNASCIAGLDTGGRKKGPDHFFFAAPGKQPAADLRGLIFEAFDFAQRRRGHREGKMSSFSALSASLR